MRLRRKIAIFGVGLVLAGSLMNAGYAAYADDLSDAEKERKRLEERKEAVETELETLEMEKSDLLEGIEELDKKTKEVNEKLDEVNGNLTVANQEYEALSVELSEAEEKEQKQYETMKKRIKYMYENGSESYIDIILSADSIRDCLNRVEYIGKITAYDNTMKKNYEATKNEVAQKKMAAGEKKDQLSILQQEIELEQSNLNRIAEKKAARLEKFNESIGNKTEEAKEYSKKLQEKEEEIEKMLLEKAAMAKDGGMSVTLVEDGLIWPLSVNGTITSHFGIRTAPTSGASSNHKGIDIAAPIGTSINAAADGTVTVATYSPSAGNYVMVSHGNGMYTAYMHASKLCCKVGDTVTQGDKIAEVGSTGVSTGPHLHFSVIVNGEYVDPEQCVSVP